MTMPAPAIRDVTEGSDLAGAFDALRHIILSGPVDQLVYVTFPGNAGDALITDATYQFLDDLNVGYVTAATSLSPGALRGKRVILGGGGNLVPHYDHAREFLDANLEGLTGLVILPHTIRNCDDLLARMGENCDVVCRERVSYEYCRMTTSKARVHLCHDMALYWSERRSAANYRSQRARQVLAPVYGKYFLKQLLRRWRYADARRDGRVAAFRADAEMTATERPSNNVDLSEVFIARRNDRWLSTAVTQALCQYLAPVREIETNRLHISILGALLGKKVTMHDNNYGKNRAIYEHSLAGRFDNLVFAS